MIEDELKELLREIREEDAEPEDEGTGILGEGTGDERMKGRYAAIDLHSSSIRG